MLLSTLTLGIGYQPDALRRVAVLITDEPAGAEQISPSRTRTYHRGAYDEGHPWFWVWQPRNITPLPMHDREWVPQGVLPWGLGGCHTGNPSLLVRENQDDMPLFIHDSNIVGTEVDQFCSHNYHSFTQ